MYQKDETTIKGKEMTIEQKYENAIDIIKSLVDAYGCKTPKWEEARNLLDIERPLIKEEVK